jgi:hypothetical protein
VICTLENGSVINNMGRVYTWVMMELSTMECTVRARNTERCVVLPFMGFLVHIEKLEKLVYMELVLGSVTSAILGWSCGF